MTDNSDMIIHTVDLHLQVCIAFYQTRVRILASLELALQVHYLILFGSDFDLHIFQLGNQIQISIRFLVSPLM